MIFSNCTPTHHLALPWWCPEARASGSEFSRNSDVNLFLQGYRPSFIWCDYRRRGLYMGVDCTIHSILMETWKINCALVDQSCIHFDFHYHLFTCRLPLLCVPMVSPKQQLQACYLNLNKFKCSWAVCKPHNRALAIRAGELDFQNKQLLKR